MVMLSREVIVDVSLFGNLPQDVVKIGLYTVGLKLKQMLVVFGHYLLVKDVWYREVWMV
jgi:hypothetical protein